MKTRYILQCGLIFIGTLVPTAIACHDVVLGFIQGMSAVPVGSYAEYSLTQAASCNHSCSSFTYTWKVNGEVVDSGPSISYGQTWSGIGTKTLSVTASCGYDSQATASKGIRVVGVASVSAGGVTSTTNNPGASQTVYVAKGSPGATIPVTAAPNPSGSWPSGRPTWKFGADTQTTTGPSISFPIDTAGTTTVTATCGTSSCAIKIIVVEVASLLPNEGTEIDDGDGNPDTKTFVVCKSDSGAVTVTATPNPGVAEASLPASWTLTGGTGTGKLSRTVDKTIPGTTTITCTAGTTSKTIKIMVVGVGSIENDRNAVCWSDPDGIVFTAIADPNGPLDCLQWQGRRKDDVNEPWSDWGTVGYSSVSPNQIRLPADTPGYYQFQARNGSDPNSWVASAEVVVVKLVTMQYNDSTNGWTDIPGIMYAHIDSLIEFRAVKEPNAAPWPSGMPVWSGSSGVSGTGDPNAVVTFGTVSSQPTDYKTVEVQCGTMLTAEVVVCLAEVKKIGFRHTPSPNYYAALPITVDDVNSISVPEWVAGGQNMPAAYIMDVNNIEIKVTIDILPSVSTALPATLWATTGSAILGNVNEKDDIYFSAGSSGDVIFTVAGASADAVSKDDVAWQWKVKDFGHSTGEIDINASGPHTIYTVLDTPVAPQAIPWIGTLDIACTAAADANSVEDATRRIWDNFYNSAGGVYDADKGESRYTPDGEDGDFYLSKWLTKYPSIGTVNCYDMAKAIVVFANALGCNAVNTFVEPFGYVYCIKPIGKEWTNNPFNENPLYSPALIESLYHPDRSSFARHAFARLGGWIYDASAGQVDVDGSPHLPSHTPHNLDGNDTWGAYYRAKLIQRGTPGPLEDKTFVIGEEP